MRALRIMIAMVALIGGTVIAVTAGRHDRSVGAVVPLAHVRDVYRVLPAKSASYLGVYAPPAPGSYSGVASFSTTVGLKPGIVMYYSGWLEPFRLDFAKAVHSQGAVPLVQIEPASVSLAAIAAGRYDGYLASFANAVRFYGDPVILSFGHEMNGGWYSWGYGHSAASDFVAAWRHIVTFFRAAGAQNVTWLWTVNVMSTAGKTRIPSPAAWWPGGPYVTWIGIDGYYFKPSFRFTSLFGPTIAAVRLLSNDPILISETGASASADQAAKIANLLVGVRTYGLLGVVWFDAHGVLDWRITTPAAAAEFHDAVISQLRLGT